MRAAWVGAAVLVAAMAQAAPVNVGPMAPAGELVLAGTTTGLEGWVQGFRARALAQGISARTFDRAFQGVQYSAEVIEKDRNQSEFVKPIWDYLDSAVSEKRLTNGARMLRQNARLLDAIERTYGVGREVVVAVWGMESSYGEFRGDRPLIGSLATLAYDGRRGAFFEQQLIAALAIIQNGDIDPGRMTGSWAGAMGHTQFIPTSYLAFAVDFTGDGRRDIWGDDPADALASTAAYLAKSGWSSGRPWGVEVALPRDYDFAQSGKKLRLPVEDWAARGVRLADGGALPDHGSAVLLLPAGARGAAFLTFGNFRAIERYNAADAYVIAVGHLSDRLRGGAPIRAQWPRDDRALVVAERVELQQRLTAAGFDTGGADGKVGPRTMAAVKAFQRAAGLPADGYASLDVLKRLR